MSGKPKGISSRLSRIKKHVSSAFSPRSASPPSQHSHAPENVTGRLDTAANHTENQHFSASVSHFESVSNVTARSVADNISVHSSPNSQRLTHHLEDSANQNSSSMLLAPPSVLQERAPMPSLTCANSAPRGIHHGQGMFSGSHHVSMLGNTFIDNSTISDNFMKELLQHTLIGAEFDSSDRDPPPRCHPETRLAIIQRCLDFIVQCHDEGKLRWVVGPAGAGKSAVMQIVAENALDGVILGASVFLSVNGRRDGNKTVLTIAYQLAVKCEPYYRFIQNEISRDPSLLRKSLSVHFKKFIVEPFIHRNLFNPSDRILIIIDGLDECDDLLIQLRLLELISDFCITYPTSPIVWFMASRPEPHITSFFEKAEVLPAFTKEEIEVDSDEACRDVQRYLRDELKKIQLAYSTLRHKREWPSELEFTKIATAAGGLFAYASTVVRYIGDPSYGDPASQLHVILVLIDGGLISGENNPLAQLDALYGRILSSIPADAMINTRKLLLLYCAEGWPAVAFREQCNSLRLSEDAAYGAVRHLYAVLRVPNPDQADNRPLEYCHKSFADYLLDFKRSGFSPNPWDEIEQLKVRVSLGIVEDVQHDFDGVTDGEDVMCHGCGYVKSGPGFCDNIPLPWPGDERFTIIDDALRLQLYLGIMSYTCYAIQGAVGDLYRNMSFFHALTTLFTTPTSAFPFKRLRDLVFDKLRPELTKLGKLKQVPLRTLDYTAVCGCIALRFTGSIGKDIEVSDPWNPSCKHERMEVLDGGWSTELQRFWHNGSDTEDNSDAEDDDHPDTKDNSDTENDIQNNAEIPQFNIKTGKEVHWECFEKDFTRKCCHCMRRFSSYFVNNPDCLVTVFVDSTEMCYVELSLVDPDDGLSQWRYRFFHSGPPKYTNA